MVTPGPLLWLTTTGDRVELGLGDRALTMPAEAGICSTPILRTDGNRSRSAGSTSSLDESSRLVVGQRLVAEGVVAPG